MSARRPSRFWRYNLNAELLAAGLAGLVLWGGSWIIMRQLQQRYLELFRGDAGRVNLYLSEHLQAGVSQLERFAQLPVLQRDRATEVILQPFSDLYLIDANQRVRRIVKATPGSRVFEGFSFAGSQIQPYLDGVHGAGTSAITRGLEDEMASIYVRRPQVGSGGNLALLGRLNLRYIQGFLSQFSRFSGTPVLLVSQDGFVMLSGASHLTVPAIDFRIAASKGDLLEVLSLEGQQWLPLVSDDTGLGARIVTLVPLERLQRQERVVLLTTAVSATLIALVFVAKNLRVRQRLFAPVSRFATQLQQLEASYRTPVPTGALLEVPTSSASDFQEIQQIQASFEALMQVIRQRDDTLQQQLRTSLTAAAIAHEINLPLSTIRLLCQRAQGQMARQQDHRDAPLNVAELVATLEQQSQQVSQVIERMRMLLRNVQTELQPTDVAMVARGACTYVKHLLREQQVQLGCSGIENDRWIVQGDAAQLQMALTNLLRNAIEAVATQPLARRRVELSLERQGQELVLRLADSGPGFALNTSDDTLFRSTKANGCGLGLFVVRTTLANHHGRMEVARSSRLGGAEVTLALALPPNLSLLSEVHS